MKRTSYHTRNWTMAKTEKSLDDGDAVVAACELHCGEGAGAGTVANVDAVGNAGVGGVALLGPDPSMLDRSGRESRTVLHRSRLHSPSLGCIPRRCCRSVP